MQSINFNNGTREFAINGDENNVIRVNITDINLMARMKEAMKSCEDAMERYAQISEPQPEQLSQADQEIRAVIDKAFAADVSSHAFGQTNCISPVGSGKPICIEFLEAFMPIITGEIKSAMAAANVTLEDKTDKYTKPVLTAVNPQPENPGIQLTTEQRDFLATLFAGQK